MENGFWRKQAGISSWKCAMLSLELYPLIRMTGEVTPASLILTNT